NLDLLHVLDVDATQEWHFLAFAPLGVGIDPLDDRGFFRSARHTLLQSGMVTDPAHPPMLPVYPPPAGVSNVFGCMPKAGWVMLGGARLGRPPDEREAVRVAAGERGGGSVAKLTVHALQQMKADGIKIMAAVCYDNQLARIMDLAGVDLI